MDCGGGGGGGSGGGGYQIDKPVANVCVYVSFEASPTLRKDET